MNYSTYKCNNQSTEYFNGSCVFGHGGTTDPDVYEVDIFHSPESGIWAPDVIQRVVTLVVIMIITLVGNTIIIIVLTCSKYRKRNSRVNIFIVNLAIGDLTVCFCTMTTEILFVAFGEWVLGAAACKILTYAQIITLASTTFILTAMSFDRYVAICNPLSFGTTTSRARKMILMSWVMAFIFALPQLFIFVQTNEGYNSKGEIKYRCRSKGYTEEWQRKVYFTFMTVYILIIPAILITFFYVNVVLVVWRQGKVIMSSKGNGILRRSMADKRAIPRAKIKTIRMTFSIIATFIACWTPYFVCTLVLIYSNYQHDIPKSVMAFAETIALLQSGLNPLLYGFFNIKLKRGLMEVFCPNKLKYDINRRQSLKSEFVSMTEETHYDQNNKRTKIVTCRGSSSSGSGERTRAAMNMITEENKNGFRLRVRFPPKESRPSDIDDGNDHVANCATSI